ncbi:unnamed protein product [Echinostoma caproni]|uniref:Histone domain-containing protein n=1 Tax=Echinostoma caproni TaxID=27848 RepID=A0A183A7K1_9TREM|nr:unnamed protein product [Echinostoma caproni]
MDPSVVSVKAAKKASKAKVPKVDTKKRRRKESYATYIYKLLSQVHPDTGISTKTMSIMTSFVNDIFECIASPNYLLTTTSARPSRVEKSKLQFGFCCPRIWPSMLSPRVPRR